MACLKPSIVLANFSSFILLTFFSIFPPLCFAQNFTVRPIGDFNHLTVMEATGNYDAKNTDGSFNFQPRQIIAKEFFKTHRDQYDFLYIFTNFDFQMPDADSRAFYLPVKNDIRGIGLELFDYSGLFGSDGKLQGIIQMGNIFNLVLDPIDPRYEETLGFLSHEQMHRWGAFVRFRDATGKISTGLLGKDLSHWSFLLNSDASVLYGNRWQDNGTGSFTSVEARRYFSPLDLYLMGLYDPSQVPPFVLIENPGINPDRLPEIGVTIEGTGHTITIGDIIAAEGERLPDVSKSQKTFKTAFILLTAPNTFTGEELYRIETLRNEWIARFSILTDGQGIVEVETVSIEEIPINPGPPAPPVDPRTIPPSIDDGVKWLVSQQRIDGSWMDLYETMGRDTAEVVLALKAFDTVQESYSLGLQWLMEARSENMDFLSRKTEALVQSAQDLTS